MNEFDRWSLVDDSTRRCLCDVGLPGRSAAETVEADGERVLWILADELVGDDSADLGARRPAHEKVGPLPAGWAERVRLAGRRCGRPTKAGRPCRAPVSVAGASCFRHRVEGGGSV
ncbi:hypothetical protein GOHSU_68_00100 [Gordonia hirsuta DSM 44140 = NBRC 16056]|uniref:Uncharacterized protein n=1 Tax=Gordonia hirsuta DSM 44140 = NBRC 16056 TaxID=1121927 RepID=L7LG44_9ACTN|nr:hypothetical protein GOHSU_68_00100 [Gordonia hirsuta DSM 44140 = NBRC 16056]